MRETARHLMNSEDHKIDMQTTSHVSTLLTLPLGWMQFQLCRSDLFTSKIPMKGASLPDLFSFLFLLSLPRRRGKGVRILMLPPKKVCTPLYPIYFSPHISFKPHTMVINFTQDPAASKGAKFPLQHSTVLLPNALSGLKDFPLSLRGLGTKLHKLGSPPHYVGKLSLPPMVPLLLLYNLFPVLCPLIFLLTAIKRSVPLCDTSILPRSAKFRTDAVLLPIKPVLSLTSPLFSLSPSSPKLRAYAHWC